MTLGTLKCKNVKMQKCKNLNIKQKKELWDY